MISSGHTHEITPVETREGLHEQHQIPVMGVITDGHGVDFGLPELVQLGNILDDETRRAVRFAVTHQDDRTCRVFQCSLQGEMGGC